MAAKSRVQAILHNKNRYVTLSADAAACQHNFEEATSATVTQYYDS